MASREELAEEELRNQYPGIPRITVRPSDIPAPALNDMAWGAPNAAGRPSNRLFEPDLDPAPAPSGFGAAEGGPQPPWQGGRLFEPDLTPAPEQPLPRPSMVEALRTQNPLASTRQGLPSLGENLRALPGAFGSLVSGAGAYLNQPLQQAPPRPPVDPTAGPRQMFQQGYPSTQPTGPGMIGRVAGELLTAPHRTIEAGRVLSDPGASPRDIDVARTQEAGGAFDVTSNIAGISAPFAALRSGTSAGVFGGRIEPGRKAFAERLEAQGKTPDQIWKEAGLVRFADKQWRQEIPDLAASYRGDADSIASRIFDQKYPEQAGKYRRDQADIRSQDAKQAALLKIQQGNLVLSDVIPHHPELYALYPELRNMPVSHDAHMQASGGYLARHKDTPEGKIVYREEPDKHGKVTPRGLTFKTLIHEIGHAIDNIEGFAKGGNNLPSNVDIAGSPARQLFEKQMAQLPKGTVTDQEVRQMRERAGQAAYNALAGEKSSLAAEMRTDFTREQLAAINPTSMMRPRLDKQFVEYNKPFDPSAPQAQIGDVLNPTPSEMQMSKRPTGLQGRPSQFYNQENWLPVKPTVLNPRRVFSPGVYENPRIVAAKAAQNVAAEHPALKELFGVTRADLYDISQQGRRKGNMEPEIFAPKKPGESYVAEGLATPQNEQRIIDTLGEGLKHRGLREGMVPWYVMDPMFQHMVKLVGKEQAIKDYQRFNATTAPFSASSDVMTEINRGTAANMYAKRGDYDTFHRFAGADRNKLPPGFPADMSDVGGHAYHAIQSDPVVRWLATGKHGYGQQIVKIPTYHAASGVPETGFQTRWPVPDAHFARGVGAADVRDTAKPGIAMKGAEYRSMAPWYREKIAEPLGIEAVPAQALQWGTMSRATGVDTPIGAGKLELLAQRIWERAHKLGIDPKAFRDAVLRGDQHAVGLLTAGAGGAAGLGSVVDPSKYQPGGT